MSKVILFVAYGKEKGVFEVIYKTEVTEEWIKERMKDSKPMVLWIKKGGGSE